MPISPDTIASSVGGFFDKSGASFLKYFMYIFWSGLIIGGLFAFWIFLQHRIKYTYAVGGASGKTGSITVRAIKNDRIRVVKDKGAEKWKTLFSRETFEPFEYKHVYPGNVVLGIKLGKNNHIPATYSIGDSDDPKLATIDPLPRSIKFWETVESQQAAYDYSDMKTRMLPTFITLATILFCLVLVGLTVWWTTKNIGSALNSWQAEVPKLQQIAQGIAPN